MPEKMMFPELFRPPVDFPDIPYDHLLRQAAERHPEHPAMIFRHQTLTYREVVSLVNCMTNGLYDMGLRKGDCLCLFTANRPEYTMTVIAAASLGVIVSPMNPAYKEHEMNSQLQDVEAKAILIQRELVPILSAVLAQSPLPQLKHILVTGAQPVEAFPQATPLATLLRHSSPKQLRHIEVTGDDVLLLPYSSGTMGMPKGAILTHRNLTVNHLQALTALGIDTTDRALLFLPFYHIYGTMLTGSFLACGGMQVLMEHFDLQRSLELCEEYRITYYFAVPPIIQALANAPVDLRKMKHVKSLFSGSAPLPLEAAHRLEEKTHIPVAQGYGLTEASPLTHAPPQHPVYIRQESIGLPIQNTEQKIVDLETGERELPVGEDGELIVRGPQVMKGYWKAPEETAHALRDGWLYTGDIGHIDVDGYTYLVDRKKDMIKYKGFAVAPAELEAILREHPAVMNAVVIGIPDEKAGERIKGFVVLRHGHRVSPEEILAFANQELASYKHLQSIECLDTLPQTASGKMLRRNLKAREQALRQERLGQ